jgi:hypothetical protein
VLIRNDPNRRKIPIQSKAALSGKAWQRSEFARPGKRIERRHAYAVFEHLTYATSAKRTTIQLLVIQFVGSPQRADPIDLILIHVCPDIFADQVVFSA